MGIKIYSVDKESIAEELEIVAGDELISIDGVVPKDVIDYNFLTSGEELTLHIKHLNGEEEIIEIEKDFEDKLGLNFEMAVFDKIKPCLNKCVFCFVDQQPKGLRSSLYVKDDDYRLSYLQGTYITLTNLTAEDKKRIETLRLGPLYVSVHTTNPELRVFMMKNKNAGGILDELKWLNKLEIPVHTQIVLCPGINDGEELTRTLNDLCKLKNSVESVAIVPVGITKFRDDDVLKKITKEQAADVIEKVNEVNKKMKKNFVFASDEFYIQAEKPFPNYENYGDFVQLEDGVGVSRMLIDDFGDNKHLLPTKLEKPFEFTMITGQLALPSLEPIVREFNKIDNLKVNLYAVKSKFWGADITVSGLVTGQDIIDLLEEKNITNQLISIPSVMLRADTEEFLDSIKIRDIEQKTQNKITVIRDTYSTIELINLINKN